MEETSEKITQILKTEEDRPPKSPPKLIFLVLGVVVLGVFSGWLLSRSKTSEKGPTQGAGIIEPEKIKSGSEFGSQSQAFKDTTVGTLEKGGVDSEGTHKLIREGGPSQTVYLTSSVLDLDQFVGKKVQIWGETFQAQKAGWLMDVGRLKILE